MAQFAGINLSSYMDKFHPFVNESKLNEFFSCFDKTFNAEDMGASIRHKINTAIIRNIIRYLSNQQLVPPINMVKLQKNFDHLDVAYKFLSQLKSNKKPQMTVPKRIDSFSWKRKVFLAHLLYSQKKTLTDLENEESTLESLDYTRKTELNAFLTPRPDKKQPEAKKDKMVKETTEDDIQKQREIKRKRDEEYFQKVVLKKKNQRIKVNVSRKNQKKPK